MQGGLPEACGTLATVPESRQAGEVLRPRVRASHPKPAKPSNIIAQVDASGELQSVPYDDWKRAWRQAQEEAHP